MYSINLIDEKLVNEIRSIIQTIEKMRLYRGKGGEIMRSGVSRLMRGIAISQLPLDERTLEIYHTTLKENLKHPNENIQTDSKEALREISKEYHQKFIKSADKFIKLLLNSAIKDENIAVTKGYSMGLGALSSSQLQKYLPEITTTLCTNMSIKNASNDDPETRLQATRAIREILQTLGVDKHPNLINIIDNLFKGTSDYSLDRRGDVGSWVREECMICLKEIVLQTYDKPEFLSKEFYLSAVQVMLKQMAEKIDLLRQIAGIQLQEILQKCPGINLPEKDLLNKTILEPALEELKAMQALYQESIESCYLQWRNPEITFPLLIDLIDSDIYGPPVLEGWVISAGGLTESTLKSSINSLRDYLSKAKFEQKVRILKLFNDIFDKNKKVDRVLIPLIISIDLIYEGTYLSDPELGAVTVPIMKNLTEEMKTKSLVKLNSLAGAFQRMLVYKEHRKGALEQLLVLLYHPFPRVRKTAADKLYMTMIDSEEIINTLIKDEASFNEVLKVLMGTEWSKKLSEIGSSRERLYSIFDLPPPSEPMAALIKKEEIKKSRIHMEALNH